MPPEKPSPLPRAAFADAGLPLYGQTAERVLQDLVSGGARSGDRLPSERTLTGRYDVSRVTLRAALAELQRRGIVASERSRGWFVAELPAPDTGDAPAATVEGFADFARTHGLTAHASVLGQQVRPATVQEAVRLRMAPGSALFTMERLRSLDEHVVVVEHNRLPLSLCPELADTDFAVASLYATLRRAATPQLPAVADYSVEARPADDRERELLQIDATVPLLVATQLTYNQHGQPLELTVASYRGDRYRFTATITNR